MLTQAEEEPPTFIYSRFDLKLEKLLPCLTESIRELEDYKEENELSQQELDRIDKQLDSYHYEKVKIEKVIDHEQ